VYGCEGIVKSTTEVEYLDVHVNPGSALTFKINKGFNSFVYLYEGKGSINGMAFQAHKAIVFKKSPEDTSVTFESSAGMKMVWLSGKPLDEPVVQYGPFVMNTMQEIQQAMSDYQYNRNGFEGASAWESKIQQKMAEY
jgi:redox-sensitive bicupin YhaK (pirin superfamily)